MEKQNMWRLAAFASPLTPVTVAFVPLVLFLPSFYAQDLGFDVAAVGAALIFARLVDAVSDPLIGFLSDRTTSRLGRRRPWILAGAPLLMLAVWNLFVPSDGMTTLGLQVAVVFVYVSWTMVFIPHQAWGAELNTEYTQRTRINVFLGLFNTFGVFLCLLIPFFFLSPQSATLKQSIFGWAMDGSVDVPERLDRILAFNGQGNVPYQDIMFFIAIVVIVLLPVTIAACLFSVKEGIKPPAPINWAKTLRLFQRNKPFARMVTGNFFLQISVQLWAAAQPFYLAYILKMPQNFLLLIVIMQGFALITVPAWGYIARWVGRGRGLAFAGICMVLGFLLLSVIPSGSLFAVIFPYLLLGAAADGKWMMPIGLAADAADYDHWKNGSEEAGLHLSVLFLTNKIGIAMGGLTLVAFGLFGFQPGTPDNSETAITAVKYISTLVPMMFSFIGVLIMWNFRLTPKVHDAIRRRLDLRAVPKSR